ncbi:hypothetical protein [Lactococcus petauri]|uniref:hypothetical protein n=1 Tax=Lactococcus petauri TaxID=1940789 RepID=UPI0025508FB2|nr:hypothetical protein [Lactococcus petauri]
MTRKQTQSIIAGLKGHNQSSITKRATRLVTGYFPIDLIKGLSSITEAFRNSPIRTTNQNNI